MYGHKIEAALAYADTDLGAVAEGSSAMREQLETCLALLAFGKDSGWVWHRIASHHITSHHITSHHITHVRQHRVSAGLVRPVTSHKNRRDRQRRAA